MEDGGGKEEEVVDGGGKEDEALVGRKSESSAGCEGKRGAGNETEVDCANLRTTPEEERAEKKKGGGRKGE